MSPFYLFFVLLGDISGDMVSPKNSATWAHGTLC
jgi:hypothetical protein